MKITWFGHSAFRVEIAGATILIDPFLTGNPSFPEGVTVEQASAGVTHILLTHGHDDHIGDTIDIAKRTGAQLTANFEICMWASGQGVDTINPMNSGGKVDCGPFQVAMTVAHHSSSTQGEGGIATYLGNPHGLVLSAANEPTLYHMGDTDIFSDMALINEFHAPKIGIVPIGDRFTMGAKAAATACKRFFGFDIIIPCHYATFPILDQSADGFLAEMGDGASKVAVPERGVAFEV
ncbi:metal-dependent hydrolase [Breoghania sp. L-A4]|uniref:metal-dependent hydrolase n=1 Tax=Breoghania sp. L-A4 TaxID=2304600 RepID=UPI000E35AA9D|nr:metal-dependent hydrolase [Breoghania sp. L-A4]AXS42609.1 metal-dependent hydrolase [Breoghania sp. L-A4]